MRLDCSQPISRLADIEAFDMKVTIIAVALSTVRLGPPRGRPREGGPVQDSARVRYAGANKIRPRLSKRNL